MESTVARRAKPYSEDLRHVLVELATKNSVDELAALTALKKRTLKRFISTVKHSGQLKPLATGKKGRPSVIDNDIALVSFSWTYIGYLR